MIMFQTRICIKILEPVSQQRNIGLINIISFMFGETRPVPRSRLIKAMPNVTLRKRNCVSYYSLNSLEPKPPFVVCLMFSS